MKRVSQQLKLEILEDRRLLATCHVVRLGDFGAGADLGGGQSRGDLRYCINKANDLPGHDTIDISATGQINLRGPLPDLASDMHIQGPGATQLLVWRHSGGDYRIFKILGGASVEISGMTIGNGATSDGAGGGIHNAGVLTLRGCVVSQNTAYAYFSNTVRRGGGIYNSGDLTIVDSTVENNTAYADGFDGLEYAYGGGIYNVGNLSVYNSTIATNAAGVDFAYGYGGGIVNGGVMVLLNTTVFGNLANLDSGGILANGSLSVISHSTISFNAPFGLVAGPHVFMRNTIVAGNSPDVRGTLASSAFNLIGNSDTGGGFSDTDILDVDPLLATLAFNGGPTPTMALLPGSPAIDAGDNADAPEFDQRGPGFPRIVNGTIDIGAFEVQATEAALPWGELAVLVTADLNGDEGMTG